MFLILLYTTTDYPNSYVDINPTKEQNNHSIKLNKGVRLYFIGSFFVSKVEPELIDYTRIANHHPTTV